MYTYLLYRGIQKNIQFNFEKSFTGRKVENHEERFVDRSSTEALWIPARGAQSSIVTLVTLIRLDMIDYYYNLLYSQDWSVLTKVHSALDQRHQCFRFSWNISYVTPKIIYSNDWREYFGDGRFLKLFYTKL